MTTGSYADVLMRIQETFHGIKYSPSLCLLVLIALSPWCCRSFSASSILVAFCHLDLIGFLPSYICRTLSLHIFLSIFPFVASSCLCSPPSSSLFPIQFFHLPTSASAIAINYRATTQLKTPFNFTISLGDRSKSLFLPPLACSTHGVFISREQPEWRRKGYPLATYTRCPMVTIFSASSSQSWTKSSRQTLDCRRVNENLCR